MEVCDKCGAKAPDSGLHRCGSVVENKKEVRCRECCFDPHEPIPLLLPNEEEMIRSNDPYRKINTIKMVRDRTGVHLLKAKNAVENYLEIMEDNMTPEQKQIQKLEGEVARWKGLLDSSKEHEGELVEENNDLRDKIYLLEERIEKFKEQLHSISERARILHHALTIAQSALQGIELELPKEDE
jgi:chromosome segregation ATPase